MVSARPAKSPQAFTPMTSSPFPPLVLVDASAVLAVQQTLSSLFPDGEHQFLTTPHIIDELRDDMSRLRVEGMVGAGELVVHHPSDEAWSHITTVCAELGNSARLSPPDQSLLALAWDKSQLTPPPQLVVLTDDYEVQNTARHLGLRYQPVRSKGIRRKVRWHFSCRACGAKLAPTERICPDCGSPVKRKASVPRKGR